MRVSLIKFPSFEKISAAICDRGIRSGGERNRLRGGVGGAARLGTVAGCRRRRAIPTPLARLDPFESAHAEIGRWLAALIKHHECHRAGPAVHYVAPHSQRERERESRSLFLSGARRRACKPRVLWIRRANPQVSPSDRAAPHSHTDTTLRHAKKIIWPEMRKNICVLQITKIENKKLGVYFWKELTSN